MRKSKFTPEQVLQNFGTKASVVSFAPRQRLPSCDSLP